MADYSMKVGYALTGRAYCRGCWNKIDKGILRLAYVIDVENYHNEKWFHLNCFKYLPQKITQIEIEDINGYDVLKPDDQQMIDIKLYNLKTMSKEEYSIQQKYYLYDIRIQDREIKNEAQKKKISKNLNQQKQNQQSQNASNAVTKKNLKLRWEQNQYKKQEMKISDNNTIQISDDDIDDIDDDDQYQTMTKKKIDKKNKDYYYQVQGEQKQEQNQETDSDQNSMDDDHLNISQSEIQAEIKPIGYVESEWESYKQNIKILQTSTALVLKELLRYNDQNQSGTKFDLLQRVADCMTLGAIPKCPICNAGKLLYDIQTGKYSCPGFYDEKEFIECNKVFNKNAIRRYQWDQF